MQQVLLHLIPEYFQRHTKLRGVPFETTPIHYTVISSLAEGADRLVAEEVLKCSGASLATVLPTKEQDYLKDFYSEESRKEFIQLLHRSSSAVSVTNRTGSGTESERDRCYEEAGRYVVDHCDILIALWDGKPAAGQGGTATIVEYARSISKPLIIVSTHPPFAIAFDPGRGLNTRSYSGVFEFNSFKTREKDDSAYADNVCRDLFASDDSASGSIERRDGIRAILAPLYVRASKVAKHNQRLYFRAGVSIHICAALAVIAIAIATIVPPFSILAFSFEAILLIAILLIVEFAERQHTHRRWIESRFLAERLRLAMVFVLCGFDVSPVRIPPTLRLAHGLDDWMMRVFDEGWRRIPAFRGASSEIDIDRAKNICTAFIKNQIRFHERKSAIAGNKGHALEIAGWAVFILALVAATFHLVFFSVLEGHHPPLMEATARFLSIALPAIGAAFSGIRSHQEYARLAVRSGNMVEVLSEFDERLTMCARVSDVLTLMKEAEESLLQESQDWLMLMRYVKLETVV